MFRHIIGALPIAIGLQSPAFLQEESPSYTFKKLAALKEPYPQGNGEAFADNFQANALNNRGEAAFGSATSNGEGVFYVDSTGEIHLVARSGDPAPGGHVYGGSGFQGPSSLNDLGEMAFIFTLNLQAAPISSGLYRFASRTGIVTPVLVPGDPVIVEEDPVRIVGTLVGAFFHPSINNRGEIAFPAFLEGGFSPEVLPPRGPGNGIGACLLRADSSGKVTTVFKPGDRAPDGKTFDYFGNPWINDRGDMVFCAHLKEDECIEVSDVTLCAESVYLRKADGEVIPIARQGDPAPGGGTYRLAFGPVINERGEVVFIGDLTPAPEKFLDLGVFLYSDGEVISIARPGDPMPPFPAGGKLVRSGITVTSAFVNDQGDVTFSGVLDTEQDLLGNGRRKPDMGIFVWKKQDRSLQVVARSGTAAPEGILAGFLPPTLYTEFFPMDFPWVLAGAVTNDLGQILLGATLADGTSHILYTVIPEPVKFKRGDVDLNDSLEITDPINLLGHLFLGDPTVLGCLDAADGDDSGVLDLTDAVYSLVHQFAGGSPPPPPFPGCGPDPTLDQDILGNPIDLGCAMHSPCS